MPNDMTLAQVREAVHRQLARWVNDSSANFRQSLLIEHDRLVGVKFQWGDYETLWQIGWSDLSITRSGTQVGTIHLSPAVAEIRRAA